ncbi:MAG: endopeptidase La [Gammaproteobacteria bacterium]|nr:endopeptidase La [Gammaproteobacteria bacterium]
MAEQKNQAEPEQNQTLEQEQAAQPENTAAVSVDSDDSHLPAIPEDVLIIVPVRNTVLFPGVILPIVVGRERSIAGLEEAIRNKRKIGLVLQRDAGVENPGSGDLYRYGTMASILRYIKTDDGSYHIICQGERRFRTLEYLDGFPFLLSRVDLIKEKEADTTDVEAREHRLKSLAFEGLDLLPQAPAEFSNAIQNMTSPGGLADMVASFIDIKPEEKQDLIETLDIKERLDKVIELLSHRIEVLRLSHKIDEQTKEAMDERQREFMLREQMRTIQKELGEEDDKAEIEELRQSIDEAGMPEEARTHALKELKRLEKMPDASAEYSMLRTYLDTLIALPWSRRSEETIDIETARRILDEDHYGLEKIKKRILEYLAVRKLNPEGRSPILCFVGPPGVGKTSLGQSIARAIGLEFVRASLGGVHDEAEIRGHRRTYVGAMPGKIIQSIRKAGTGNPVFMLDEMDKLGASFHGDPSSALLEVLDPEQNSTFQDNYLGVAFDLSKVMFIGTANVLDSIPGPLRDRMEIIQLPGYTPEEKFEIAKRYLIQRQLKQNGLTEDQAQISDKALEHLISDYTREAGCRNLEREIGSVLRNAAVTIAEGKAEHVSINADDLKDILGPPKYESEVAMRTCMPGVATGLAWTPTGGDILFIEASRVPGKGNLILTGQLGDVMKESAQAALSLVKSRADTLGIESGYFENSDIHVHVPAGAIPKDGPSAGVAMVTALVSLVTGRTVRHDVAMTGEISLRGLVLPVGGIKEKVVAAARAGIKTVLLPKRNERDYDDIPESARKQVEFIWLENVDDVIKHALAEPEESRSQSDNSLPRASQA